MQTNTFQSFLKFATTFAAGAVLAVSLIAPGTLRADQSLIKISAATESADPAQSASLPLEVGNVSRARGTIQALRREERHTLDQGAFIKFQDVIVTGKETRAEITLIDDSQLFLGDDTELKIDELVYDPNAPKAVVVNLSKGVFRMISGTFNKTDGGSLTVVTPVATIGVRGTDFWGLQEPGKLTMVLIDDGILEIKGAGDKVILHRPLTGVVIEAGSDRIKRFSITPEQLGEAAKTITY